MDSESKYGNVALITGISGQDGSYLAELLLEKGYIVHGIIRRCSTFNTGRIIHLFGQETVNKNFILHYGDLTDSANLLSILSKSKPDLVFNLAAQSHVKVSFDTAEYTGNVDGIGTLRLLEAIKSIDGLVEKVRFYQASTSEMFGGVSDKPLNELSEFHPRSPYAAAKLYAFWIVKNYRDAYGIHASNGILFNHESERRGPTFVTRKITRGVARIKAGKQDCLVLGNLNAVRDWGYAKDYVYGMYLMLQNSNPDDYVIGTGEAFSVRQFVEAAFEVVNVKVIWTGSGLEEVGRDSESGAIIVKIDEKYFRPTEVNFLLCDPSKVKKKLGWSPKTSFQEMVKLMVESDMKLLSEGREND